MSLHEFLLNYKFHSLFNDHIRDGQHLTNKEIIIIEQAYYNNKSYKLDSVLYEPLAEWLCDPETIGTLGGYF